MMKKPNLDDIKKIKEQKIIVEYEKQVRTFIMSALGFVAALAWRDAIQQTISKLIPLEEGLTYQYFNAIIITFIAVIITYLITREKSKEE